MYKWYYIIGIFIVDEKKHIHNIQSLKQTYIDVMFSPLLYDDIFHEVMNTMTYTVKPVA